MALPTSHASTLQAENHGLRLQLENVIGAARNVQDVLRRLWSQHESEQLQIQQLEKELSLEKELRAKGSRAREAWADERSVPDGVRSASAPERKAATHAPEVGNAAQEPPCVQSIRKRADDAIRSRAEEANKKKTGAAKRDDTPTWKAQSWLEDAGSSAKLAELLLAPLRKSEQETENDLELITALANYEDSDRAVSELLEYSNALPEIARFISDKMKELVAAEAPSGVELNKKFVDDYTASEMAFGQQDEFFKGLEGLIGPPNPDLVKGIRVEHCERTDSHWPFTTSNYGIETTSRASMVRVPFLTAGRAAAHRSQSPPAYSGFQRAPEERPRRTGAEYGPRNALAPKRRRSLDHQANPNPNPNPNPNQAHRVPDRGRSRLAQRPIVREGRPLAALPSQLRRCARAQAAVRLLAQAGRAQRAA